MINTQADILMLGAIKNSESVGLYVVANKLASLVVFVLVSSNSVLAPTISNLYSERNFAKLQKIVLKSSQIVFFASCLVASILILNRKFLLAFFGLEFLDADSVLIILIFGQIINAFVGPVGLLLNMSGHERISLFIFAIGAMTNIILNYALIPLYGATGAAIATTSSMILWNILGFICVIKYLRINSMVVPVRIAST